MQARFAREQVRFEGNASTFVRVGDGGGRATMRFCPTCGTTVWWELDGLPGFVAVAVGAFADPTFPAPSVSIYEARRHAWAATPDADVEHLD